MSRRCRRHFYFLLPFFLVFLSSATASAQIVDKFLSHIEDSKPRTIHTIWELDYFPSVEGAKYGLPVIRFDLNFIEDDDERMVGEPYYHSVWGNAIGYGGHGIITLEEFITAGVSYRVHEKFEASLAWEPIGIYVNPNRGIVGSGLTAQFAFPLLTIEVNERAQGMAFGFATQREPNMRVRNIKARFNIAPGIYATITRQGIGLSEGPMTSIALGVGM
jgi:hypothetical protein